MQPGEAGAPKEVEEEGFGGVVAVVGGEDGGIGVELAELLEVVVAQLACRLLDALVVPGGMGAGVELCDMDWDCVGVGELSDECFVAVAVGRTEVEVAMGYGKWIAGGVHEVGEDHGVDAATNSEQHLLPCGEEVLLLDVCYERL